VATRWQRMAVSSRFREWMSGIRQTIRGAPRRRCPYRWTMPCPAYGEIP
jgi:hypothetical protein